MSIVVASYVGVPHLDSDLSWKVEHVGAFGIGFAVATLLSIGPWRRVILGLLLAAPTTYAIGIKTADMIGACLIVAATLWWLLRLAPVVMPTPGRPRPVKDLRPHFEELARQWCRWHAHPHTLGDRPSVVQSATLACPQHCQGHELDVVVGRHRPGLRDRVLAIGEAKWTTSPVGEAELTRLEHLRDLTPADRYDDPLRLLLFSRTGFTGELRHTADTRADVELVDLDRLYQGG